MRERRLRHCVIMFAEKSTGEHFFKKSPAERIGASRAEFSRQIKELVESDMHGRALELIKYAKLEQLVKQGVGDESELKETDDAWDEVAFLDELQSNVIKLLQQKRKENH